MPRPELRWPGRTARAVPPGGPSPPLAPSQVTSVTADAAATVSWVNPGSGAAATSYTVTPYIAAAAQATTTVTAPATSAAVTGLTNATAYTFTVTANNAGGSSPESAASGANTPRVNLLFGDEFNGSYLDPAWAVWNRDGDQSNSELQYHVPARVSLDGSSNLVLHAQSGSVTLPGYDDANPPTYTGSNVTRAYTTGAVSWASFAYTYGKLQISAKMAQGSNLWPVLWMIGTDCQPTMPLNPDNVGTCSWPSTGSQEIDVAEFTTGGSSFGCTLWYSGGDHTGSSTASSPGTTYHTYELDWAAGTVSFLLDGSVVVGPFTSNVPASGMCLIMQTAIRGTPSFTQPDLIVDWVRCFHN